MKFPRLLHVIQEKYSDGTSGVSVMDGGVSDPEIEETTPCAIYQFVQAGKVEVSRRFVPNRPAPKKRGKR
jgi:hypothetical protein